MKKTIQKPENWQDFETLCKKLWGEIWEIPMRVKKNGRNGQPQAGVDIYGIPKGKSNYWGIQCKGKDEYANAKLTKAEIDNEIKKAREFKPSLSVFIFATTMNKGVEIEEYVRIKDLESRQNGEFEILLFCWEDIADLIEENQDTYNYYVRNKQHKTKFDFEVYLNDFKKEFVIRPKCIRKIRRYQIDEDVSQNTEFNLRDLILNNASLLPLNRINEATCSFTIIMENTGSNVIEDWEVELIFKGEYDEILDDQYPFNSKIDLATWVKYKKTYINENRITYTPLDNSSLVQKMNHSFKADIVPQCKSYVIPMEWKLFARNFDASGKLYLKVEPDFEDEIIYTKVSTTEELKEDEIISVKAKKNYD